nr:CAP domain-containing protein [uncultured Duganella sp.]
MEKWRLSLTGLLAATWLTGCGIGGTDEEAVRKKHEAANQPTEAGAPTLTNNNATDGFNWINYRRKQVGVAVLTRNSQIDAAAQGHSDYQRTNNTITHEQTAGKTGYTGVRLTDRLNAAGYTLGTVYAAGEVISATTNTTGFAQADELITAIYHRYVMFDPAFRDMGVGSATVSGGYTYFTADFGVTGSYNSLGRGQLVTYPVNNQTGVPVNFYSDTEAPDPVPNQNLVGYPISVHADTYGSTSGTVVVQGFTVTPRGGSALSTRLLSFDAGNNNNVQSAASIIPLAPLAAATTYDVSFSGTVGGVSVTRNWSFTTK